MLLLLNVLFRTTIRALTSVVREFSVRILEEMDFTQEAQNIALFHQYFAGDIRARLRGFPVHGSACSCSSG